MIEGSQTRLTNESFESPFPTHVHEEREEEASRSKQFSSGLNVEDLRFSQDFHDLLEVKKTTLCVPVRKPSKQEYIRVHPQQEYTMRTFVIEIKDDQETYVVSQQLWESLNTELKPVQLFTAVNRQSVVFLIPVPLPGPDGKHNPWHRSLLEALSHAKVGWVRIVANKSLGAYEVYCAQGTLPDPTWPSIIFNDLFNTAFQNYYIDSLEHPVVKRLRGEA